MNSILEPPPSMQYCVYLKGVLVTFTKKLATSCIAGTDRGGGGGVGRERVCQRELCLRCTAPKAYVCHILS